MKRADYRTGMTLVEVLISVVLMAAAAAIIYEGIFYSYKTVMRSRARLDAQGIAFDKIMEIYNQRTDMIRNWGGWTGAVITSTPPNSVFSTNGSVQWAVVPETNPPAAQIDYWTITVRVWAPSNSPLFSVVATNGTVTAAYLHPLAEYMVLRYDDGVL